MADLANSGVFLGRKLTPEDKLWKAVLGYDPRYIFRKAKDKINKWLPNGA